MSVLSDYELGWLVGILEGEAHFGLLKHKNNPWQTQRVAVKMTDEDIVNKVSVMFQRITGNEVPVRFISKTSKNPNHQDIYEVYIGGENARKVMRYVVKHMGARRKQKIWQSLNGYRTSDIKAADLFKLVVNNA